MIVPLQMRTPEWLHRQKIQLNPAITMNKSLIVFGAVLGLSIFTVIAQEKQGAQHPTKGSSKTTATTEHKVLAPGEMQWGEAPPGLPAGGQMAVLDGDPNKKGSFTVRLKAPDGYKVAPHTHPTAERLTIISGTLHLGTGEKFDEAAAREMTPGSFAVLPAGMKHSAWSTGESVVQIQSEGPFQIKYVNPTDDPRNVKKE
jgi:quercetin dioxygenase-like cupin family protein